MPRDAFRFLHAANLFLDHPLRGVGPVPDSQRDVLERATLIAWDRVVNTAVQRRVDFVLLAGNSFDAHDQSLLGQVALIEGLTKLGDHDIPVFIVPGVADPDMAWRLSNPLPENVTRFGGELSEPINLSREGRTFCTIHHVMANLRDLNSADANGLDELAVFAPQLGSSDVGPFDIALLETIVHDAALPPELTDSGEVPEIRSSTRPKPVRHNFDPELVARCPIEYWALGEGPIRNSWRVGRGTAHSPGSPQGLNANQSGILGCTVVDVEGDGRVRESFVPTASVRWESVVLNLTPHLTRDTAVQQLQTTLESLPHTSLKECWLISLKVTGFGRVYEELEDRDFQDRFWADAIRSWNSKDVQLLLRQVKLNNPTDGLPGTDFLSQEFVRQLQSWSNSSINLPDRLLASSPLAETHWSGRMKSELVRHDLKDASADAQRIGLGWLKNA